MGKHARNANNSAVYTYSERQTDRTEGGYGTQTRRVGSDSIADVDVCALSLQPCTNPVITCVRVCTGVAVFMSIMRCVFRGLCSACFSHVRMLF